MLWLPTDRLLVEKVAWPATRVPVPIVAAPSLKVTEPDGVPEPGAVALTVAVNVVDWPKTVGLTELVRAVDVPAWLTVWAAVALVLPLKFESPAYVAVSDLDPDVVEVRLQVPVDVPPEPETVAIQLSVPSETVTDPEG